MISKNEIKYIQSLYHKKNRDAENVFIAEGPKLINDLLQTNSKFRKIYATENNLFSHYNNQCPIEEINSIELGRISQMQTPNLALAIIEKSSNNKMPDFSGKITLALDGIQDPGNMGTIIRSADWFGVDQIIATEDTVDKYNPKVVQASMGSIARVNVWYGDLNTILNSAKVPIYGAMMQGESLYQQKGIKEAVLIIGNEGNGIRKELISKIQFPLTIPAFGGAESLNASVATGIILSHLRMNAS